MSKPIEFIHETIRGGIFIVIPLTVILAILAKTHALLKELTDPITKLLPTNILGINGEFLITFTSLILACFFGGLLLRSKRIKHRVDLLEDKVLSRIPGYSFIKAAATESFGEDDKPMKTVMIRDDVAFMLGIVIEQNEHLCTVYIPGAPNVSSGEIKIYDSKDVIPLNVKAKDVIASISRLGKGSNQWLMDAQK